LLALLIRSDVFTARAATHRIQQCMLVKPAGLEYKAVAGNHFKRNINRTFLIGQVATYCVVTHKGQSSLAIYVKSLSAKTLTASKWLSSMMFSAAAEFQEIIRVNSIVDRCVLADIDSVHISQDIMSRLKNSNSKTMELPLS
jgi:hypothetical protein